MDRAHSTDPWASRSWAAANVLCRRGTRCEGMCARVPAVRALARKSEGAMRIWSQTAAVARRILLELARARRAPRPRIRVPVERRGCRPRPTAFHPSSIPWSDSRQMLPTPSWRPSPPATAARTRAARLLCPAPGSHSRSRRKRIAPAPQRPVRLDRQMPHDRLPVCGGPGLNRQRRNEGDSQLGAHAHHPHCPFRL